MSPFLIGSLGIVGFIILVVIGLPISFSFAVSGLIGIIAIAGFKPAMSLLGSAPYAFTTNEMLIALPTFVLMGFLSFHSGISGDLYAAAEKWLGRLRGGLAMATTLACSGFAACTGDSLAATATMGTVSFPSMQKLNYNPSLSTASIACGGALAVLIPPSIPFIVYGYLTQTSVAKLFIAGIIPGILLALMLCITIYIICIRNPKLGPSGNSYSLNEKIRSLQGIWPMLILILLVIGGLYVGFFTPSEAGALGAFGALIIGLIKRRLNRVRITDALSGSLNIICFVFTIIIGAMIFNTLLSISGFSSVLSKFISTVNLPPYIVLIIVIFIYFILGMFMDPLAMTLLTVPTFVPIMVNLGFDPIWFGVLFVVMNEIAFLTPPVGANVYVVNGVTGVPLEIIFKGIIPFVITLLIFVTIIIIFPDIVLFLPYLVK